MSGYTLALAHSDCQERAFELYLTCGLLTMGTDIPDEFKEVATYALRALGPIRPADKSTNAKHDFLFSAVKSAKSGTLPPYYFIYFLFVDLLKFPNLGAFEKISWSIPIDYNGKAFLIEHRKFGVGVFVQDPETDEETAKDIVSRINSAVRAARRYFDWLAGNAVAGTNLNVVNKSYSLFSHYEFFRDSYREKLKEAELCKGVMVDVDSSALLMAAVLPTAFPGLQKNSEARALAMAAIEAFFSWSEHVFIHIAILFGKLKTGTDVANIAKAEWSEKFKAALDISEPELKRFFDLLMKMRKEIRNYIAHGSFGKDGEAFSFHSGAGAVPVLLPHNEGKRTFSLGPGSEFDVALALDTIEKFVELLWSGARLPAKIYIFSDLPSILSYASNGKYARAMGSGEAMKEMIEHLYHQADRAANMDW